MSAFSTPHTIDDPLEEGRIEQVLDWLSNAASSDPADELRLLHGHLRSLSEAAVSASQFDRILDMFFARVQRITPELKLRLRQATLPLSRPLRQIAHQLSEAHRLMAEGYERMLNDVEQRKTRNPRRSPVRIAGRALRAVADQLEVTTLAAAPTTGGLWNMAHRLYLESRRERARCGFNDDVRPDPESCYREMLLLAAIQPDSLAAPELTLAADYLRRLTDLVPVGFDAAPAADRTAFWIDPEGDAPPTPTARRGAPGEGVGMLQFSTTHVADAINEHLLALERGISPEEAGLPDEAADPSYPALLRRLHQHLADPAKRQLPRRRNNYRVRLCIGIDALWRRLAQAPLPGEVQPASSDWMVLNESPSGYALMHVAGHLDALRHGAVVGVQAADGDPWQVCVIRWLSSENPEHVEIGLQLLSPAARPVQVAFHNGGEGKPAPALLLKPVPALRRGPTLLVAAGTCRSRRFVLISDGERLYVTQGRVQGMELQTACAEMFQYAADPYPT
ncbi:MAG: hypothetical protein HY778_16585 [Betaproteobacteria bacterium]|nr:hypothetical protein [Betaproteobacteria bacterium]